VSGRIDISGAYLRFDEHGTCHTDASALIEQVTIDATAWHGGHRWLCIHEEGNPECPSIDGEWLIVSRASSGGAIGYIVGSPPSTHTSDGLEEEVEK
jgi:hypothetical protein